MKIVWYPHSWFGWKPALDMNSQVGLYKFNPAIRIGRARVVFTCVEVVKLSKPLQ